MTGYLVIEWPQLALSALFLVAAAGLSLKYRLGLEKDLVVGGIRCFVQLLIMGYVLQIVFGLESALVVVGLFMVMGLFAARIAGDRVKAKGASFFWPTFISIQVTFVTVTFLITHFIVRADPWWTPQYAVPIGGMLAGNAMNTIALSLDRFYADLHAKRAEIELRLALGASSAEAGEDIFRDALRTGMIPAINSLMGVGLVALPGMMTGQILAGASPADAVRYQVVVMLMMVATTALASWCVLVLVRRRCFGPGHNLIIGR